MKYFIKISSDHIDRLLYMIRNTACCRSLDCYRKSFDQSYWILIYNNFYDIAVLEWCKIFGTDSENTHWKNIVDDHEEFRKGLLNKLDFNDSQWKKYWQDIKDYRNDLISHYKCNTKVQTYPKLDKALEAAFYYYDWLVTELEKHNVRQDPEYIKGYYEFCLQQSSKFSNFAFGSTKELGENIF